MMTALDRLHAIDAIQQLMGRRIRALDGRDWTTYRACHADDFVSHSFAEPMIGADVMMAGLLKAMAGVDSIHHVHSPEISIVSPTEATGYWALEDWLRWKQGDEDHHLHGWGHYEDSYGLRNGEWLFTSRRILRLRVEMTPGAKMPG